MAVSVLNVGGEENEELLRRAAGSASDYSLVHTVTDLSEARFWASEHQPDITLVDMCRFNDEGIRFLRGFRADPLCADLPLLALVSEGDRDYRHEALRAGANEYVTSPLDPYECQLRVLNMLTVRAHRRLMNRSAFTASAIGNFSDYALAREREILLRLARAGEYRDETTGSHIVRIGRMCRGIANVMGLEPSECTIIEAAAPMHDIGKIGIPDAILHKNGALTDAEREIMRSHTLIGYEILKDSSSPLVQRGAEIALAHHEKFDGSGYPYGLSGAAIPLSARIVAVADVFDALTSTRSYKLGWSAGQALNYIAEQAGRHFDPECARALQVSLGETGSND